MKLAPTINVEREWIIRAAISGKINETVELSEESIRICNSYSSC